MTEAKAKPILVKKLQHPSKCQEGAHTFIVTGWVVGNGKEKASAMRCQHCLMPLDLGEIEIAAWAKSEGINV